jgi:hypothetical protein
MKNLFIIIFLLLSVRSFSQKINYCNYFSLEVKESEYDGKKTKSYWTVILNSNKDKFSKFVTKHNLRFDYILWKNANKFNDVASFYPDTNRIRNEFCKTVINTKDIQNYFPSLTPDNITDWNIVADTFTTNELMLVASKYFYCDAINKKDTTIQSHTCVVINGQKEYKSERDLTLLEAFSIEAIFSYINKKKDPLFYREFYTFKRKMVKEKRADLTDFESFLIEIRNLCYTEMQNNSDLKEKLLNYYHKNRNNLNFIIK